MAAVAEMGTEERKPFFRDIRRYYCEYCGICRSKKALITAHILSNHKDKHEKDEEEVENTMPTVKKYACPHCDAVFKKPAYLKQHMQGHSIESYSVKHWIPCKELQNAKRLNQQS